MMPRTRKPLEKSILVMVEGNDDIALFEKLLVDMGLDDRIQVWNAGGTSEFKTTLSDLPLQPGFHRIQKLAIIADADADPERTLRTLEHYVQQAALPQALEVRLHTVPHDRPGMLEDLCMASVSTDPIMSCVDSFLQCIEANMEVPPRNRSKSKFLAFMASRPTATNGTVEATVQKQYFPLEHEAFARIRKLLRDLVSD